MLGMYEAWLALHSSLLVSDGIGFEKPRPLQAVHPSVTTRFFNIAVWIQTQYCDVHTHKQRQYYNIYLLLLIHQRSHFSKTLQEGTHKLSSHIHYKIRIELGISRLLPSNMQPTWLLPKEVQGSCLKSATWQWLINSLAVVTFSCVSVIT